MSDKSFGSIADLWQCVSEDRKILRNLCQECGWPLRFPIDHRPLCDEDGDVKYIRHASSVPGDKPRDCPACGCVQRYMKGPRAEVTEPKYSRDVVRNILDGEIRGAIQWAFGREDLVGLDAYAKDRCALVLERTEPATRARKEDPSAPE